MMKSIVSASALLASTSAFVPSNHRAPTTSSLQAFPNPFRNLFRAQADVDTAADLVASDFENVSPADVTPESDSTIQGGAKEGQAEVVLVGCGAPNRGMGWYHAIQMLEGRYVLSVGRLVSVNRERKIDGSFRRKKR